MVKVEIAKWYKDRDVAFAIGVDELPIGGSYKYGPEDEKWDTFYWYRAKNDFWTIHWKPILDKNPWVHYSMGWVPSHTSPANKQNYPEPKGIDKKELTWKSVIGRQWIREVMKPIFSHGSKHYDQWVGHGYWHEEGINHYYPYWNPKSELFKKGWPYTDKNFLQNSLREMQKAFNYVWGHDCTVWNTIPFGEARPDLPTLFPKYGIYAVGLWLNLKKQPLDRLTNLKKISTTSKSYKGKIGSTIEAEGTFYNNSCIHKAVVGDIRYWYQDPKIFDLKTTNPAHIKVNGSIISPLFIGTQNDKIIAVPYSVALEGNFRNFKKRVCCMIKNYKKFDAPVLYYFMHAQMNWADALGGGLLLHRLKNVNKANGLKGLLAKILSKTICKLVKWGENARKHEKELEWLHKKYGNRIWMAEFSQMCQYFDIRKNAKIELKNLKPLVFTVDAGKCFKWGGRVIFVSIKINGLGIKQIKGYYIKNGKKKTIINDKSKFVKNKESILLVDVPVSSKIKTEIGLV